ncbi:peptidase M42 family protein [Gottschalkia purinilytica]|uniref:Peptidase M42 family protein n=1 Tax=Gottschalkia purinilytica TaxID=1503 RepID=A0A0L0WBV6_GOTPU|nr:M20/M25/M40 family metallo-hydrolase [Gottschalkia purinilytica]KNF08952.1 peptidase M42 family protein [Gottschalkia purinilytica]
MDLRDAVTKLSDAHGVSGYEHNISIILKDIFTEFCSDINVDKLGNFYAIKRGEDRKIENNIKIMLAAHMDEIGFMVSNIEDNGLVSFSTIGGFDPRTLLFQDVIIHSKNEILGVVVPKDFNNKSDNADKAKTIEDLAVDIGHDKENAKKLVEIGDTITIKRASLALRENIVSGKALDDRAGIAVMLECAKELMNFKHESDVYFVGTVQEEVGIRGATVSTYNINPDIGIAIDVGFGHTSELPEESTLKMGKGPGITLGANIHPKLREKIVEIAQEYNIPFQYELDPGPTGTDARAIQITRCGIPTLLISLPLKYMHTSVETINLVDIKNAGKLLARFISYITKDNLEELLCY